ncbi:Protein of unknown function [Cotesia congregata]|uniref:Uncharacterized protein n=1 Tax=Cotesia congregata TaxID=51543 RepID=A0A8J2H807_COTCN|nr:Protein of unknown function [Cotesia congregata]
MKQPWNQSFFGHMAVGISNKRSVAEVQLFLDNFLDPEGGKHSHVQFLHFGKSLKITEAFFSGEDLR